MSKDVLYPWEMEDCDSSSNPDVCNDSVEHGCWDCAYMLREENVCMDSDVKCNWKAISKQGSAPAKFVP